MYSRTNFPHVQTDKPSVRLRNKHTNFAKLFPQRAINNPRKDRRAALIYKHPEIYKKRDWQLEKDDRPTFPRALLNINLLSLVAKFSIMTLRDFSILSLFYFVSSSTALSSLDPTSYYPSMPAMSECETQVSKDSVAMDVKWILNSSSRGVLNCRQL
jgi:hypothetical protein